jgi:hypothetical protein
VRNKGDWILTTDHAVDMVMQAANAGFAAGVRAAEEVAERNEECIHPGVFAFSGNVPCYCSRQQPVPHYRHETEFCSRCGRNVPIAEL